MLSITIRRPDSFDFLNSWHVGEPIPSDIASAATSYPNGIQIRADGDELEYIRDNFTEIPYVLNKRSQVWHGEFARFILNNL